MAAVLRTSRAEMVLSSSSRHIRISSWVEKNRSPGPSKTITQYSASRKINTLPAWVGATTREAGGAYPPECRTAEATRTRFRSSSTVPCGCSYPGTATCPVPVQQSERINDKVEHKYRLPHLTAVRTCIKRLALAAMDWKVWPSVLHTRCVLA